MPDELSVLDWAQHTPLELRARGVQPEDRIHFIGQDRHLLRVWAPCIGFWSVLDTCEFINSAQIDQGLIRVKPKTYRAFKARLGLLTGSEFQRIHGTRQYRLAELAYAAHAKAQQAIYQRNGTYCSLGVACREAYLATRFHPLVTRRIGILPVEMTLWTRLFGTMLAEHKLSWPQWSGLTADEKSWIWGGDDDADEASCPWKLRTIADKPAPRFLDGFEGAV